MTIVSEMKDGRRAKIYIGQLKTSGLVVAVVVRSSDQIFRGGANTLTEARHAGTLCWMMDSNLLPYIVDTYKISHLITFERNTGDMWVSKVEDWADPEKLHTLTGAALTNLSYRGLANKYLPVHHMLHMPGETQLMIGRGAANR